MLVGAALTTAAVAPPAAETVLGVGSVSMTDTPSGASTAFLRNVQSRKRAVELGRAATAVPNIALEASPDDSAAAGRSALPRKLQPVKVAWVRGPMSAAAAWLCWKRVNVQSAARCHRSALAIAVSGGGEGRVRGGVRWDAIVGDQAGFQRVCVLARLLITWLLGCEKGGGGGDSAAVAVCRP